MRAKVAARPSPSQPGEATATLRAVAPSLETVLDPAYLGDLEARPLEEVRAMRADCQEVETGLSYLRRLVQGRLDIVGTELRRRADGGDPTDLTDLISRLPEILSDRGRAPGLGRLPQTMAPAALDPSLEGRLEGIVSAGDISALPEVDDDTLEAMAASLEQFEHEVSGERKALFERIDALQAEITRRYKTGEASVETLLS
jgi:hypothetical protein